MSARVGVLHLVDSLATGGAERMAVNLANALPRVRFRPFLGTTRHDGPLASAVADDVQRLRLDRRGRFDLGAIRRLGRFVVDNDIRIVHAHSSSLFIAVIARALIDRGRRPVVVWHDHYGRHDTAPRRPWPYRVAVRGAAGVIAVNPKLATWSREALGVPEARVWYLRNFVLPAPDTPAATVPGTAGRRLVCVANFRRQKDHANLVRAMARLVEQVPDAHLLLIGRGDETRAAVEQAIATQNLGHHISLLGGRDDVPAVLRACDIGVLPSASEGLPLALLEYGQAGLATVATRVGECRGVLDDGAAGLLVPPGDSDALAAALVTLLGDPTHRDALGARLRHRVETVYGVDAALAMLESCYRTMLETA